MTRKQQGKRWRDRHPEYGREYSRRWRAANPDYWREWAKRNRTTLRENAVQYRAKNRDVLKVARHLDISVPAARALLQGTSVVVVTDGKAVHSREIKEQLTVT